VHSIINRLTPADWHRYMSMYPVQAVAALHQRVKSLDVDISVKITSASGASEQAETQQLIAAKQSGIPISDPEIMERLNVDPDVQAQRQSDWARKQAITAGVMPQAPAANNSAANNPAAAKEPAEQPA
jgi:hypothetical protein